MKRISATGWAMLAIGAAALLAGCVSTPQSRINRNPGLFASFPPEAQAKIRQGQVDVGFSRDMVNMALGAPDRVATRTSARGKTEIWSYTGVRYSNRMEPVESDYWYRGRDRRLRYATDVTWVNVEYRHEYTALRIEFEEGKVSSIERMR